MTHTLITLLGRTPKDEQGYRETRYTFPDGSQEQAEFFGWPLLGRLKPERLVVLGTAGSMWDHLFERDSRHVDLGDTALEERLHLDEAVRKKQVEQAMLTPLAPLLGERLGCEVRLQLIPYARDEAEQLELLRIMAAQVNVGDRVSLDVTHAFRHLPMLALFSALHLRTAKKVEIAGIWYGAYDEDTKAAPVHNLNGLLRIADWITALSTFDKDGDYAAFAPLLEADGLTTVAVNHLRRAAFFERTSNARDAVKELANFGKTLEQGLPGIGELFAEPLRERTQWQRGRNNPYEQQRHLAEVYLDHGDYIRAAIFAYEALVTRLTEQNQGNPVDYQERDAARRAYESDRTIARKQKDDYWLLNNLRNTLAHGNEALDPRVPGIVGDEKRLRAELQRLLKSLLS